MAALSKIHTRVNNVRKAKELHAKIQEDSEGGDMRSLSDILKELDERGMSPPNQFWDAALNLYHVIRDGIEQASLAMGNKMTEFCADEQRKAQVKNPTRLNGLILQYALDTQDYLQSVDLIYAKHKDRRGGTLDHDDHMHMLAVENEYRQAISLFDTTVKPIVDEINEIMGVAQDAMEAFVRQALAERQAQIAQQQADLADPTVTSDIQFKDA